MIDITVFENFSIIETMKKLAKSNLGCLVVVTPKTKILLGTINDGDLRRAILNGHKLIKSIKSIYNKNPIVFLENTYTKAQIKKQYIENKIDLVPIINSKKKYIKYILVKDFLNKSVVNYTIDNIDFVIMAGGKGKRIQPFTNILPKPLVPFNDKPILQHIIENAITYQPNKLIISLNYKANIIKSFIKELKFKIKLDYIIEKKELGTIGSLSIYKKKYSDYIIVSNSDIITKIDYNELLLLHKKNKNLVTLVVTADEYTYPYGTCILNSSGNLKKIIEKPKFQFLSNTGVYIMNKEVVKYIKYNTKFDVTDLFNKLIKNKKKIGIYPISNLNWMDFGEWDKLLGNIKYE